MKSAIKTVGIYGFGFANGVMAGITISIVGIVGIYASSKSDRKKRPTYKDYYSSRKETA